MFIFIIKIRRLIGTSVYLDNLINEVLALSESDIWELAVKEWKIADCEEDLSRSSDCICGKENLRYLFTIENELNGNYLYPIGSSCIRKFGREDLKSETKVQEDMFRLLHAVENNEFITLDSGYFTRKLIVALYEEGAFEDNVYNNYDGMNDCQFLLDMFNKRDKTNISSAQKRKIRALIGYTILPFLKQKLDNKIH